MRGSWGVYMSVVDGHQKALEKLFELAESDQRRVGTIISEAYAGIWWGPHGLGLGKARVTASKLNQISRLHNRATGSIP